MITSKEQFFGRRKAKSEIVDIQSTGDQITITALSVLDKENFLEYSKQNAGKHVRWMAYAICLSCDFLGAGDVDKVLTELELEDITGIGGQILELSGMSAQAAEDAEKN